MAPPSNDPQTLELLQAQIKRIDFLTTQLTSLNSAITREFMEVNKILFDRESESVRESIMKAQAEVNSKRIEQLEKDIQERKKKLQNTKGLLEVYIKEIEKQGRDKKEGFSWLRDFNYFAKYVEAYSSWLRSGQE